MSVARSSVYSKEVEENCRCDLIILELVTTLDFSRFNSVGFAEGEKISTDAEDFRVWFRA